MENQKRNTVLYILIITLFVLVLALGGYIVYDKIINDKEIGSDSNLNTENANNNVEQDLNLKGKVSLNDYCPMSGGCEKELGNININNQKLKLSVNLKNLNTENVSGDIILGTKKINISNLSYFEHEKVIDGFEVYQNYLILYTSSLDTIKNDKGNCQVRGYMMYILDSNLEEVSGLAGYTQNSAFKDFKIENDYLYYYGLSLGFSTDSENPSTLIYSKINFNDLLSKKYDNFDFISSINECKFS